MRCLALAEDLREYGVDCQFICREDPGHLQHLIASRGFTRPLAAGNERTLDPKSDAAQTIALLRPHAPADWLLVDHYGLGLEWELEMRSLIPRLIVMDDEPDRKHACEILINGNVYDEQTARTQRDNVPSGCLTLLGPRYALLRAEFTEALRTSRLRDGSIRTILITFGGSDATNETGKTLRAISSMPEANDIDLDVVLGNANP